MLDSVCPKRLAKSKNIPFIITVSLVLVARVNDRQLSGWMAEFSLKRTFLGDIDLK